MLDKLIESKNNKTQEKKVRKFLLTTSTVIFSGVVFALIFSLFSQNLAMGQDTIDISNLISPTAIPENAPTPPEPIKKSATKNEESIKTKLPTRRDNILRLDESPKKIPQSVSTTPSTSKARPTSNFTIDLKDDSGEQASTFSNNTNHKSNEIGVGFNKPVDDSTRKNEIEIPKVTKKELPPPPVNKAETPKKTIVSKGVINGNAIKLVTPSYPAAAKSMQLRGQVTVQVMIDENGKVISAQAIKGHALLKDNAVRAARNSLFSPTTLSGVKVKVSGLIVYNFN